MKHLPITPLLQSQIDRVLNAATVYPNADDGFAPLERERLALAEEVMRVYAAQQHRLERLPQRAAPALGAVVDVALRPKRRRRA